MFKIIVFLCVVFAVEVTFSAVAILPPQEKPPEFSCQQGCYVPELNRVLPYNVPFSPQDGKSCMQYTCGTDNYTQIFTCGALGVAENCRRVPGNKYLPYNKCCDTVECEPVPKEPEQPKEPKAPKEPKEPEKPKEPKAPKEEPKPCKD